MFFYLKQPVNIQGEQSTFFLDLKHACVLNF